MIWFSSDACSLRRRKTLHAPAPFWVSTIDASCERGCTYSNKTVWTLKVSGSVLFNIHRKWQRTVRPELTVGSLQPLTCPDPCCRNLDPRNYTQMINYASEKSPGRRSDRMEYIYWSADKEKTQPESNMATAKATTQTQETTYSEDHLPEFTPMPW